MNEMRVEHTGGWGVDERVVKKTEEDGGWKIELLRRTRKGGEEKEMGGYWVNDGGSEENRI